MNINKSTFSQALDALLSGCCFMIRRPCWPDNEYMYMRDDCKISILRRNYNTSICTYMTNEDLNANDYQVMAISKI